VKYDRKKKKKKKKKRERPRFPVNFEMQKKKKASVFTRWVSKDFATGVYPRPLHGSPCAGCRSALHQLHDMPDGVPSL